MAHVIEVLSFASLKVERDNEPQERETEDYTETEAVFRHVTTLAVQSIRTLMLSWSIWHNESTKE